MLSIALIVLAAAMLCGVVVARIIRPRAFTTRRRRRPRQK